MEFRQEIEPLAGVGGVRFGSTRAIVRKSLGRPDEVVRKPDWNPQPTDIYLRLGRSFSYDAVGLLAEVELFAPARASVLGVELLGWPAERVLSQLRSLPGVAVSPNDPCSFPGIGVSVAIRSGGPGEPLQSVTASAWPNLREPEFFGASQQHIASPGEIGRGEVGSMPVPGDRQSMRGLLGDGMAVDWYGRPVDVFIQGIVVEYGDSEIPARITVNRAGPAIQGLPARVAVGVLYSECVRALAEHSLSYVEGEAEIRLPDEGISLLMARGGDPALPVAAIAVDVRHDFARDNDEA